MSLPVSAIGTTFLWMGVGSCHPSCEMALRSGRETFSASKLVWAFAFLSLGACSKKDSFFVS
jgi:hypothetical protein